MRWDDPQTVRLTIRPELINGGGLLSGVVTYALVDYCMGSTLWAQTTAEERIATISISINYVQTATEGDVDLPHDIGQAQSAHGGDAQRGRPRGRPAARDGDRQLHDLPAASPRRAGGARVLKAMAQKRTPVALTIAGSDSGGGAGIQADLKAFARCGVHGTSAITAITAQNTLGVSEIHAVPAATILAQVRAVCADMPPDAVKVGMLGSADAAGAVARALGELPRETPVVVDPVMVAESGARLLDAGAERVLVEQVLPRASVLTPNLPEARALLGRAAESSGGEEEQRAEAEELARELLALGPAAVVVTGGHRASAVDVFLAVGADARAVEIAGARHPDGAAHGSGCTHSSLLAAQLALGLDALAAARVARVLAGEAVRDGLRDVGGGAGPVDVLGLARIRAARGGAEAGTDAGAAGPAGES